MDTTSKRLFDELQELSKDIQNGLNEMLVFDDRLSRFDKRTLKLFIMMTSDHTKLEEILKLLEKLERHCFKKPNICKVENNRRKEQPRT